jgi:hypothetical protein
MVISFENMTTIDISNKPEYFTSTYITKRIFSESRIIGIKQSSLIIGNKVFMRATITKSINSNLKIQVVSKENTKISYI